MQTWNNGPNVSKYAKTSFFYDSNVRILEKTRISGRQNLNFKVNFIEYYFYNMLRKYCKS